MNCFRLKVERLWRDADSMLELRLALAGGGYEAWEDVYMYPESIQLFATQLKAFTGEVSEEAILEAGSTEPNALNWVRLRAYVVDSLGHSAFQFASSRNGTPLYEHKFDFSRPIEVAALNEMGKALEAWIASDDASFVFEARSD